MLASPGVISDSWMIAERATLCSDNNRDGYKTTLENLASGSNCLEKLFGFMESFENAERIGEVLRVEVTS